jgi:hypothetical protein
VGIFDDLGDIAEDIASGVGDIAEDLVQATGDMFEGGGQLAGVAMAAGSFFVVGPGYVIPAFLAGSVAAGGAIKRMTPHSGAQPDCPGKPDRGELRSPPSGFLEARRSEATHTNPPHPQTVECGLITPAICDANAGAPRTQIHTD